MSDDPTRRSPVRTLARAALVGGVAGAVALGTAWAGVVLAPTGATGELPAGGTPVPVAGSAAADAAVEAAVAPLDLPTGSTAAGVPVAATAGRLPQGRFLAGSAKTSIAPRADRWKPDVPAGTCGQPEAYTPRSDDGCLLTFDRRWATKVDPLGVHVRAAAIGNGERTVVITTMDTVGWFSAYPAHVCGDCGSIAIGKKVEQLTGGAVKADGVVITSSHTHAAGDTLAGSPSWYYEQVRDAITTSIVEAVADLRPVVLETGSTPAKAYNVDRRIVTRAVPDYELGWLRAKESEGGDRTVVTLVNYAAHPTVRVNNAELHSGFAGPLSRDIEQAWGGVALFLPGGLGDQTVDRGFGTEGLGSGIAGLVLEDATQGRPYRIKDNTIAVDRRDVALPAENGFLLAAQGAGLFVRDTLPPHSAAGGPRAVQRSQARRPSCVTTSLLDVVTPITGIRIGRAGIPGAAGRGDRGDSVTFVTAPGEAFASIALVTKDYLSKTRNTFVLGMANDTLGYLIPKEQYDETGAQGVGFANNATDAGNYEEALSLGRCAGDAVQNAMIQSGERLGVVGSGEGY